MLGTNGSALMLAPMTLNGMSSEREEEAFIVLKDANASAYASGPFSLLFSSSIYFPSDYGRSHTVQKILQSERGGHCIPLAYCSPVDKAFSAVRQWSLVKRFLKKNLLMNLAAEADTSRR